MTNSEKQRSNSVHIQPLAMKLLWAVVVVITAVLLAHHYLPGETSESPEIHFWKAALSFIDSSPQASTIHYNNVAVGYNTNADLVSDAVLVLQRLGFSEPPSKIDRKSHDKIQRLADFSSLVAYFMTQGSAAERVIVDRDVCTSIVSAARATGGTFLLFLLFLIVCAFLTLSVLSGVELIGGNAALIAMRMAEHTTVSLAGNLPDNLKKKLHSRIGLLEGIEPADPVEAHLILEYKKGQVWGDIVAPRANRVIVHCDRTNAEFRVVSSFHSHINNVSDLIVVSGLHLLDQDDFATQRERTQLVLQNIAAPHLPNSIPAHLELASMGNLNYIEHIGREVAPNFDSLGLNEQELGFLYFALTHPTSSFASAMERTEAANAYVKEFFTDPSVQLSTEALAKVLSLPSSSSRHLARIHFHSLKYHIIATKSDGPWQDSRVGVLFGSLAATSNACGFASHTAIDPSQADLLSVFGLEDSTSPVSTLSTPSGVHFAISRVMVCSRPLRTVGLGDSISAAGLLHHKFSRL